MQRVLRRARRHKQKSLVTCDRYRRQQQQQLQTRLEKLDQQHLQHQVEAAYKKIAARFDSIIKRFGYKHDPIITVQLCFFLLAQADPIAKINAARVVHEILRRVKGPISEHLAQVQALEHQQHHSQFPRALLDDQRWKYLCTIVNIRLSVFPLLAPAHFD